MISQEEAVKRLRWKCRRGMLELDLLLEKFLDKKYRHLSLEEQQQFENLLEIADPILWGWLLGHVPVNDVKFIHIVSLIQDSQY